MNAISLKIRESNSCFTIILSVITFGQMLLVGTCMGVRHPRVLPKKLSQLENEGVNDLFFLKNYLTVFFHNFLSVGKLVKIVCEEVSPQICKIFDDLFYGQQLNSGTPLKKHIFLRLVPADVLRRL